MQTKMKQYVHDAVVELTKQPNLITSTLEIKDFLIKNHPDIFWRQQFVSDTMDENYKDWGLGYKDNGVFREYMNNLSLPTKLFKESIDSYFITSSIAYKKYRIDDFVRKYPKYSEIIESIFDNFVKEYSDEYETYFSDYRNTIVITKKSHIQKLDDCAKKISEFVDVVLKTITENISDAFIINAIGEVYPQYKEIVYQSYIKFKELYGNKYEFYYDFPIEYVKLKEKVEENIKSQIDINEAANKFADTIDVYLDKVKYSRYGNYALLSYRKSDFLDKYPEYSEYFDEIYEEFKTKNNKYNKFEIVLDNDLKDDYRLYLVKNNKKDKKPKKDNRISRSKALELMKSNKGKIFTVVFEKKGGIERTITGIYVKNQTESAIGYVKVKEFIKAKNTPDDCIRNVNLQTLKTLKINGEVFRVRS